MSEKHRQDDQWDAAMTKCPTMYCGRLDMTTWNAFTCERQKMVYFDGEDQRVVCEGRRADFVAYAANRYQPLVAEIDRLKKLIPHIDDIELAIRANNLSCDDLGFIEHHCQCDPSVGAVPCPYCAIDSVLKRLLKAVKNSVAGEES